MNKKLLLSFVLLISVSIFCSDATENTQTLTADSKQSEHGFLEELFFHQSIFTYKDEQTGVISEYEIKKIQYLLLIAGRTLAYKSPDNNVYYYTCLIFTYLLCITQNKHIPVSPRYSIFTKMIASVAILVALNMTTKKLFNLNEHLSSATYYALRYAGYAYYTGNLLPFSSHNQEEAPEDRMLTI